MAKRQFCPEAVVHAVHLFSSGNPIPTSTSSDALATLMELGFPREKCIDALTANLRYTTFYNMFKLKIFILFHFVHVHILERAFTQGI